MHRVARVALVIVLSVLAADALLALVGLGDPVLLQVDEASGYVMKPNQSHFRFLVHTNINNKSMRSDTFNERKTDGTLRLLFVGDSLTYGTTRIDQNDIFTEVLRRELPNLVHRKVETLNASASAWAIGNELGYLRSRGTFQSDLVVLVLNDGDLSQKFSTPYDIGSQLSFLRPACALCELAQRFTRSQTSDKGTSKSDDAEQALANMRELNEFRGLVSASGSRMMILFVPFRKDIKSSGEKVLQPQLSGWASSNTVPVVDASDYLERLSVPEASVDGGTHLSVKGNAAVAKAFEDYCRSQPASLSATLIPARMH